jgi:hypothetical protein
MATFRINSADLAKELQARAKGARRVVQLAAKKAAMAGRTHLIRQIDEEDKVYQGQFKNAWSIRKTSRGYDLVNSAPHAGIVERGARPHSVSMEGRADIERWCQLRLGATEEEAKSITQSIIEKLGRVGQKGTFIVERSLGKLGAIWQDQIQRDLTTFANRSVGHEP